MNLKRSIVYEWAVFKLVFVYGDTTTIRAILAVASLGWAVGLLLPLHTFDRTAFAVMSAVMPDWLWALLFTAHFVGVWSRLRDSREKLWWGFVVNAYGLILWMFNTGILTYQVGKYTPTTSLEWTVLIAAFVALIRTGLNDERTTA